MLINSSSNINFENDGFSITHLYILRNLFKMSISEQHIHTLSVGNIEHF